MTLLAPEEEILSWGMYPYPYLARVDPDARKGTLIYQLVAYYSNKENASAGITYTLIAGTSTLKKMLKFCCRFFLIISHFTILLIDFSLGEHLKVQQVEAGGTLGKTVMWMVIFLAATFFALLLF